ncbi:MAG: hypothetical protein E7643_01740 [Ruminococcaceae bacterium]|nr:hypothetical protein [Oscillospiraceae bacterium]
MKKEAKKAFPKKPHIRKLGTIFCNNIVETTPLVYKGELYRFEVVRRKSFAAENANAIGHWSELADDPCLRFVHVRTNQATPIFAEGHTFGFPYAEGDVMYVVTGGSRDWGSDSLVFFRSTDLVSWEKYAELEMPGWKIYNMNIAKMGDVYTMLIEISAPAEECGRPFTFRFLQSRNLTDWELMPSECVFQKERYAGSPSLYAFDGDPYYYVGYLEAYPEARYANSIARSKDLIHWEYSPVNPVLMYDEEDRKIASPFLSPADRQRIKDALNVNNSDMELCEFLGRTIIYYSWGDQRGTEFLAEACFEGPMHEFLRAFFEPTE